MNSFLGRLIGLAVVCVQASLSASAASIRVPVGDENRMVIHSKGFRFGFEDRAGKTLASAHTGAGASLNGSALSVEKRLDTHRFALVSGKGERATLTISHDEGHTQLALVAEVPASNTQPHLFAVQLAGMPVAYGLGDTGGWSKTLNLVTDKETTYALTHSGGRYRWLSSFTIFPQNRVAGVCFGGLEQAVTLSKDRYKMTVKTADLAEFSFFTGAMPDLYASYQRLLNRRGYPVVKPKFRLFELGWESWAALGYQTRADTILRSVENFQDKGYPVRWAVSGSGFWEEGGTTTSFGKYGEKFPDPAAFKKALHQRNVKWMIGLRTNFVLPGGPHIPKSKKRDQNLKGDFFNGNPLTVVGLEKGYFLVDDSGSPLVKTSSYFPIVPCHILNGENPDAVDWYVGLYKLWDVDGIKEDTMMKMGATHTGVFNDPMGRLANDGALVMARCGSYTSYGTLLRINDTSVNDLAGRTPINYLQYAASGAPNVYSDTVGFKQMKSYSEKVVRHAWLMALTAGLAVGESPEKWKESEQAIFKKPFDFHYQFGPYLYDAAMKSYKTGYPYTMTPLGIAYPEDSEAAEPAHYQWMVGESLLCAPLLKNYQSGTMDLYLPEGTWFDYDTGEKHRGPKLLKDFSMPVEKTPCFVGGKGVLVTRESDESPLRVHIYPVKRNLEVFTFHHPDGETVSMIEFSGSGTLLEVTGAGGNPLTVKKNSSSAVISFELKPGSRYKATYR